jgi:fused signal recognition particle receptor
MFDLLKKKIASFVDSVTKKAGEAPQEKAERETPAEKSREFPVEKPQAKKLPVPAAAEKPVEKQVERPVEKKPAAKPAETVPAQVTAPKPEIKPKAAVKPPAPRAAAEEKIAPKIGLLGKVKAAFTGEITVSEKEADDLLRELEISLLESDVSYDAALFIEGELRKRIAGKKFPSSRLGEEVRGQVASVVAGVFPPKKDFFHMVTDKKAAGLPFIVLFVGPNGMGKSTTIAKIAFLLKQRGYTSVIAASDTFRAAAIPQIREHADRLGIPLVAHAAGSDPTAVAFDAVALAKSRKLDCVLVDTAGRQETNYNLVREMEKMNRVLKPDFRVFVAEAIAGHSVVEQVKKFDESAGGVDGIILTKIDCDAKGGGAVGIAFESKKPILFVTTGQDYEDIEEFDPELFAKKVTGVAE